MTVQMADKQTQFYCIVMLLYQPLQLRVSQSIIELPCPVDTMESYYHLE